jgi:hypothetical protein
MKRKAIDVSSRGAVVVQVLSVMFVLFLILLPSLIMAATVEGPKNDETPTMVRRHIFSPEDEKPADKALGPRSEAAAKLEKEFLFTGVIHSPQGKWAIIRPKNKIKREDAAWRLREGDEIQGYHIDEIGSNYIILVSKDKPVRLDLYRGTKSRPAPPPEPEVPLTPVSATAVDSEQREVAKGVVPSAQPATNSGAKAPLIRRRDSNPPAAVESSDPNSKTPATQRSNTSLADILKRARQNNQTGGSPPTNPFSQIIRQRQGK